MLGILCRPCSLAAGGEIAHPAVLILQNAAHEVVHGGRLVDPGLAGGVAGDLAQQLCLIGGGFASLLSGGRINSAVPVTGVLHVGVLLDNTEVQAVGSSIGGSKHTAVASAHDQDVGVHGLGDGSLVDVRLFAQPVVLVTGGQLNAGDHGFALGLCKAALGCLHDGIGGHGRTGHAVDLGRTGSEQLLLELVGCGGTIGSGLAGGIDDHVGDSAVGEGHGDLDGGGDALGSALVGAGDVLTGSTGSGSGSRAGSGIAGSQGTGGHTAHGGGSGNLDKALTGDLVHRYALFLFILLCIPSYPAAR